MIISIRKIQSILPHGIYQLSTVSLPERLSNVLRLERHCDRLKFGMVPDRVDRFSANGHLVMTCQKSCSTRRQHGKVVLHGGYTSHDSPHPTYQLIVHVNVYGILKIRKQVYWLSTSRNFAGQAARESLSANSAGVNKPRAWWGRTWSWRWRSRARSTALMVRSPRWTDQNPERRARLLRSTPPLMSGRRGGRTWRGMPASRRAVSNSCMTP